MGRNIFVSYKYADTDVYPLENISWWNPTKVRDYVDLLAEKLKENGHVYMGEGSDEDLSSYSDDYIYEHLKDKIYPTTITIVLISPNMKVEGRYDKSQWIPWEIYYSLYQANRNGRISHTNAILAVVLPDKNGDYSYMLEYNSCCSIACRTIYTDKLFTILKENIFNKKQPEVNTCTTNRKIYRGDFGYITVVKWSDFSANMDLYLSMAELKRDMIDEYEMHRNVNQ